MADLNERAVVGVGIVVQNQEGKILLGKRINSHGAGQYSLPGGKPDGGEHPGMAAARELYEETGLVAYGLTPLDVWTYDRFEEDGFHFVTLYFACYIDSEQEARLVEPDKCEGWQWYEANALPSPLFCGVERAVART